MTSVPRAVPTNIITGSLGAGKTTLIHNLLKAKPTDERWAILINEFGEVGIDAALFEQRKMDGVYIREVPGGCMCCTSSLPMQIALNQLLAAARPHRLLIEPTGLGHPKEVLQTLREAHYRDVLDVRATLTLVDARKTRDTQWCEHQTFRDQLTVADAIVATKTDLYQSDERAQLSAFLQGMNLSTTLLTDNLDTRCLSTLLDTPCRIALPHGHHHHHAAQATSNIAELIRQQGYARLLNEGEGYFSYGWVFPADKAFDLVTLQRVIEETEVERLKGVFITTEGIVAFNQVDGVLTQMALDEAEDSRLEFISADKQTGDRFARKLETVLLG